MLFIEFIIFNSVMYLYNGWNTKLQKYRICVLIVIYIFKLTLKWRSNIIINLIIYAY